MDRTGRCGGSSVWTVVDALAARGKEDEVGESSEHAGPRGVDDRYERCLESASQFTTQRHHPQLRSPHQ